MTSRCRRAVISAYSGSTTSNITISSGGVETVSSGGVVSAGTKILNGGSEDILSGGNVTGAVISSGGSETDQRWWHGH